VKEKLIAFEKRVAEAFDAGLVKGPIHLSGGNEDQLYEVFRNIGRDEWLFSTYRSHYHALLKGIPEDWLFNEILEGRSMCISSPEHKFHSSAIVGGCLSQAVGVAYALKLNKVNKMVHCFVGDMAATTGAFYEAHQYAKGQRLHIKFYVENNGLSCDTPTEEVWGPQEYGTVYRNEYKYTRQHAHAGTGKDLF
jgi:TPP-dependent pyruvate/acetoin dehydrogenase alpha subunit